MPTTTTGVATEFINFTRASNATVTDSNGVIKWAAHNLLTNSESFDNTSGWSVQRGIVTANNAAAPNGTTTAEKFTEDNTANTRSVLSLSAIAVPQATAGIFLKDGATNGRRYVSLILADGATGANGFLATFDLVNGTWTRQLVGTGSLPDVTMTSLGGGWYYCAISGVTTSTSAMSYLVSPATSATPTVGGTFGRENYTGDGVKNFLFWGAHLYRSDLGGMQPNTSAYPMYNPTTPKNLLGFTENFDNAAWVSSIGGTGVATVVTTNAGIAPNGLQTADRIQFSLGGGSTATDLSRRVQAFSTVSSTPYTLSMWVKSFDGSPYTMHLVSAAGVTVNTVSVTNEWQRVSVTANGFGGNINFGIGLRGAQTPTNSNTADILVWGAQLSDSASLDPYVANHFTAPSAAAYYGPRRDFDSAGVCRGLLVEEQRTNFVLNSGLSGGVSGTPGTAPTSWSYFATGTPSVTIATDTETVTGSTLRIVTDATQRLPFGQTVSVAANKTYFLSAVVDVTTSSAVYQHISWSSVPAGATVTHAIDGVVVANTTTIGTGRHIISSILVVSATAGTAAMRLGSGVQLAGAASDITFRQIQVEDGAFRTSYIPTTTASATRLADVAQVSTAAFPYSQTGGTLVAAWQQLAPSVSGAFYNIAALRTDANNRVNLYVSATSMVPTVASRAAGVTDFSSTFTAISANSLNKIGIALSANNSIAACNGVLGTLDTTVSVPPVDTMPIGSDGSAPLNGWMRQITYIPRRLSDAELTARTA